MLDKKNIAGVILAGGRSSRMGQSKAMLDYNGRTLLDHMIEMLHQAGLNDIYISGSFDGYRCIPDAMPYEGPAYAMYDVLKDLERYEGVLFVPVDMPLVHIDALRLLLKQEKGAYFENFLLPAYILCSCTNKKQKSVRGFLQFLKVPKISLPDEMISSMANVNTPEDWNKVFYA